MDLRRSFPFAVLILAACSTQGPEPGRRILPNDNQVAAGHQRASVRTLALEIREGDWYPESDTGISEPILAFAEVGKPLQVPGPLIRVPTGTVIRATIRNRSSRPLVLHGMFTRPGRGDSRPLLPDSTADVEFSAGAPGTYYYWAAAPSADLETRAGVESLLDGALVVDPADGTVADRVFVIGVWTQPVDSNGPRPWVPRDVMTINGKMWPYTERFSFTEGDSVRWRWVNPSRDNHPMHLHGFYYTVDSRGDWRADSTYAVTDRRAVVTQQVLIGETMTMRWQAERPGNWLFHCHFAFHVSHFLSLSKIPDPEDPFGPDVMAHSPHVMAGLILGLQVKPREGAPAPAADLRPRRQLRLVARPVPVTKAQEEAYGFFLTGDGIAPRDSADAMLILRRNEPVRITVVNALRAASAVHWHGIEVENSYADGVPAWSGSGERLMPAIAPGDSFIVEFTPPRAGSFMYHSHSNEDHQISHGLYAPLLVLDEGERFDPVHDRIFMLGGDEVDGRFNRKGKPAPQNFRAGERYRLRIININTNRRASFALHSDRDTLDWRPVAKDGMPLPASQATLRPALEGLAPGEILDVEFRPAVAGRYRLEANAYVDPFTVVAPIDVR